MPEKALVFGADSPIGLAVCRDLHRHGVEVYVVARNRFSLGLHSRAARWGTVFRGSREAAVELVISIARQHGADRLMAIGESDIMSFNRARERLEAAGVTLMFPDAETMAAVLDKDRTLACARTLGIDTPQTWQLDAASALEPVIGDIRFPVILKWANPHLVVEGLGRHRIEMLKAEYCLDAPALRAAIRRYAPVGRFPMIQEYIPGNGLGQMIVMHEGEPVLAFQHRRIHEWPPEGGVSSSCVSLPADAHPEIMEKSVALLRALRWQGAAMVEYRYDPATGRAALMEVNGRFWGSLPLAFHAGAPFPYFQYCAFAGTAVPPAPPYRAGLRCTFMIPDAKRLIRIVFQRHLIRDPLVRLSRLREIADFALGLLDPRRRYYVFSLADPMPFAYDMLGIASAALGKLPVRVGPAMGVGKEQA